VGTGGTVVHAYGHGDCGVGFTVFFIGPVVGREFFDRAHGDFYLLKRYVTTNEIPNPIRKYNIGSPLFEWWG
jgi:hypothetical protein